MATTNVFKIDDGKEEFTLKNKKNELICKFSFNPSDVGIIDRYNEIIKSFDNEDDKEIEDVIESIEYINKICCEKIDYLLASNVSNDIFSILKPMSVMTNGDFFFETILELIGTIVEEKTQTRLEKKRVKIQKATEKYTKK